MRWSIEELIYGIKVASNNERNLWYRSIHLFSSGKRITEVVFKWIFTGYCWATIWGLDYYLMETFVERLKVFKKLNGFGYPHREGEIESQEDWDKIIDRLIHGFEVMISEEYSLEYIKECDLNTIFTKKIINGHECTALSFERSPEQEKFMYDCWKKQEDYDKETMRLFTKYFRSLWD
jgi:hypothetical protein